MHSWNELSQCESQFALLASKMPLSQGWRCRAPNQGPGVSCPWDSASAAGQQVVAAGLSSFLCRFRAMKHLDGRAPGPASRKGRCTGTTWTEELIPAKAQTAECAVHVLGDGNLSLCLRKWGQMERPEPTCPTRGLAQANHPIPSRSPNPLWMAVGCPGHQFYAS